MPRYFFNMVEGDSKNIVKDPEGVVLPGLREARKEAIGYARNVVKHGFRESQTWKVVVNDDNGIQVLTVALSEIRIRHWAWLDLRRRFAAFEPSLGPRTFACLIAAAMIGIIIQASVRREAVTTKESRNYQIASAATGAAIVAVRFAPQASAADITKFLDAYNASLVGGPRPAGFYRLRIGEATMPLEELAKLVDRMAREKVVEFAATVQ